MESHRGTQTDSSDVSDVPDVSDVLEDNGEEEPNREPATYSLFECGECSAVALGVRGDGANLTCHGKPMEEVGAYPDPDVVIENGSLSVAVEVYEYAFENCPVSVTGIAERLGYDRETVSEHIQALVEAGFLEERTPKLEGGSSVRVYEPRRVD